MPKWRDILATLFLVGVAGSYLWFYVSWRIQGRHDWAELHDRYPFMFGIAGLVIFWIGISVVVRKFLEQGANGITRIDLFRVVLYGAGFMVCAFRVAYALSKAF